MNNAVFGKNMENFRKGSGIKLVTSKARRNYFAVEIKAQTVMNKPVYMVLSILELNKIVQYIKPKFCENTKLYSLDAGNFTVHIKTDCIYKDIAEDVETRFGTSNYELNRSLPNVKNNEITKLIEKMNYVENIMKKNVFTVKNYCYLTDEGSEDRKKMAQKSVS